MPPSTVTISALPAASGPSKPNRGKPQCQNQVWRTSGLYNNTGLKIRYHCMKSFWQFLPICFRLDSAYSNRIHIFTICSSNSSDFPHFFPRSSPNCFHIRVFDFLSISNKFDVYLLSSHLHGKTIRFTYKQSKFDARAISFILM